MIKKKDIIMELNELTAISPIDGRYRNKTEKLDIFFSEFSLIKYRVFVEIEYFIALSTIPLPQLKEFSVDEIDFLRTIYTEFCIEDAQRVKEIEKITNHDVKAVEYFIKEKLENIALNKYSEFIHFGLTSQDINNTAMPIAIKEFLVEYYYPVLKQITDKLQELAIEWGKTPMLARTHGQPASPTCLDKEIIVFIERLARQIYLLKLIPHSAKFGGATGNFNAHFVAYPEIDWHNFADKFVAEQLGLKRSFPTTQIEHYDNLAAQLDGTKRINTILLDFCRDIWTYISMEYFKQKITKGEVGSSAMPHKVNPIDFENAEGNLGIANAVFAHLSEKLPVSRLQRDLTDSTVIRNVGVPFANSVIAFKSIIKGLNKLIINKEAIEKDLEANWSVVAEAIQTILRRENFPKPYEALKELTRTNQRIDKTCIQQFINNLDISEQLKNELLQITPFNYIGK